MKIGILTQPLHSNYGGLLQAYALQTILKRLGHNPYIIQRVYPKTPVMKTLWDIHLLNIARFIFGKEIQYHITQKEISKIRINTNEFIDNEIQHKTIKLYTDKELTQCVAKEKFDAYIVGSDQVWRKAYSPNIFNYFLDFCKDDQSVKKLSYAASFGTDKLQDYTHAEIEQCRTLAKLFDGISVRESSGVDIVNKEFGTEAEFVLDPTLLLNKEHYVNLIKGKTTTTNKGKVFYYVLDKNNNTYKIIEKVAQSKSTTAFTVYPELPVNEKNIRKEIEKCIYPSVYDWINAFNSAEMIFTDSFHGCVFSIIFNKPFWVFINENRGSARFDSLLGLFGLQDRIIKTSNFDITTFDSQKEIDWDSVNKIIKDKQKDSLNFITNILKK